MITVKNLKKNFGDLTVLKGIDVTIEKGECVVVIGPSGSGKSTFLRCLNRLEEPDGGEIDIEGTDLLSPHTDINEMRQRIGMVFQHFNLFPHKTILENVTLAPIKLKKMPQKEAEDAALELLRRVGIQYTAVFRRADAADGEIAAEAKVKCRAVIVTKRNKEIIAGFSALGISARRKAAQLYISGGGAKAAYVRILGKAVCLAAIGHGDVAYIFANDFFCKPFAGKCIRQSRRYA